jgi:ATP-binding cassette subfamily C protein CydC
LVAVVQGLSAVALLATSAWLISRAAEQPPIMYLSIAVVGVRTFALARASLRYAERWLSHDAVLRGTGQRRVDVFANLINFVPAGLGRESTAELSTRVVADVDETQNLGLRIFSPLVQSFSVSLISIAFFWFLLPEAAIVMALLLALAYLLALPVSSAVAKRADNSSAHDRALLSVSTSELIENYELLAAYQWLNEQSNRIELIQAKLASSARRQALALGASQAVFSFGAALSAVASAVIGAAYLADGKTDAVMLAVYALLPLAVFDVASVSQPVVGAWRRFRASAVRLIELTTRQVPPELAISHGAGVLSDIDSLQLESVELGYPGSETVVKGLSLGLTRGDSLSITGPSGAGKSTVALALAGLLQPRSGALRINGQLASTFSEDSIRLHIGYLEQSAVVFSTTVAANLRVARPLATDQELIAVLNNVGLWSMFSTRDGLETQVGENASLISGGEAQRLAFARALLANFDCIILDEPTASVDQAQAQALVQDLLKAAAAQRRILVLITHDVALAKLTDRTLEI